MMPKPLVPSLEDEASLSEEKRLTYLESIKDTAKQMSILLDNLLATTQGEQWRPSS